MRTVPLSNHPGYVLVDDEDYERVAQYAWFAMPNGYVYRSDKKGLPRGKTRAMYLHRFLMNAAEGTEVDHVNRRPFDNRRQNLRTASRSQNKMNGGKMHVRAGRVTASRYKGVSWHGKTQTWHAKLQVNGRPISLRYHKTQEDAARAYDAAAREHFGEFASLNFPERRTA